MKRESFSDWNKTILFMQKFVQFQFGKSAFPFTEDELSLAVQFSNFA